MPSLADVPVEVLLDNLLPSVDIRDLLSLACTSKFFSLLCADDMFWKRKLQSDFNFSGAGTARTSGWKLIYKGLHNPRVFVWGNKDHGRLGLSHLPRMGVKDGVPFPVELPFPGIRVVSIVAGGMSFHALDANGYVYAWGTLDGISPTLTSDGFSEPGKQAPRPLRLALPTRTRSISCGRLHLTTLDDTGYTWTFLSWGRPFRLVSPALDCTSIDSTPLQVECGWAFSSVLTKSGDVFVFWPFKEGMLTQIAAKNAQFDREGGKKVKVAGSEDVIPCVTWDLHMDPIRLPNLPPLPELGEANESDENIVLTQIAALDNNLVGLTNKGHVLKYGNLVDETSAAGGQWEYLPNFSEVERVRRHPTFTPTEGRTPDDTVNPPEKMQITHISAHFQHFIAYSTGSSSIVIMGSMDTTAESEPTILPALQHKSVISVVLGDYHNGALTANGKLLTWGNYSRGALGLGDPTTLDIGTPGGFRAKEARQFALAHGRGTPPSVEVPTEVRFDHGLKKRRERFCFAATAAGWHMGALVIDLEDSEYEENGDDSDEGPAQPMPGQFPHPLPRAPFGPGDVPILPTRGFGAFRIGFAGRGSHRGDAQ